MKRKTNRERARDALKRFFESITGQARWWYVIKMDADEPDSLASLLGLTMDEFEKVFVAAGFFSRQGNTLVYHASKFASFIDGERLKMEPDLSMLSLFGLNDAYVVSVGTPRKRNVDFINARLQFKTRETQARRPLLRIDRQRHELRCRLGKWVNHLLDALIKVEDDVGAATLDVAGNIG